MQQILALALLLIAATAVSGFRPIAAQQSSALKHSFASLPSLRNPSSPLSSLRMMSSEGTMGLSKPKADSLGSKLWNGYVKTTDLLTTLFPLWTILFAGIAIKKPESFSWFTTKYFTASLGALMLSMGITLTPDDFTRVTKEPAKVIVGFLLCYALMPALGLGLGKAFKLPVDLIAGLILVGSINGGQASNLCTYIARGDVALSGIQYMYILCPSFIFL